MINEMQDDGQPIYHDCDQLIPWSRSFPAFQEDFRKLFEVWIKSGIQSLVFCKHLPVVHRTSHLPKAGPLTKVTICKDREGKPKSFGFVCFKHPESVSYAIALLNGIRLYGRPINVQYRFGSSRSSEPANQNFESCVKINSHTYRNEEILGRSSFPMQFFPINNTALPQEYFFFQKMQRHAHNPVLQLPYYEMTAQLPNSTSGSSSLSHVPDLDAGPSSYEWTIQQPSDSDLYQMNTRKRQKQTSDSDSSTENNRGNEFSQKFRKCKKKKRY
ncbi:splicing regulator RBM11 isoform X1 [Marmota monax]|uniref:splicing regulator RBM11 isoform X1 n=1 Tax=Marmota monax TaxID=9995 RepID=UPI001EB08DDF|nr:splicing regulator RBM11 isoform X1 [Marmota monax]